MIGDLNLSLDLIRVWHLILFSVSPSPHFPCFLSLALAMRGLVIATQGSEHANQKHTHNIYKLPQLFLLCICPCQQIYLMVAQRRQVLVVADIDQCRPAVNQYRYLKFL